MSRWFRTRLRLLAAAGFAGLLAGAFPVLAAAAPGDLDRSFSGDGKVATSFPGWEADGAGGGAVAVQPNHRIVAVGTVGGEDDAAVARYLPSGALDGSFDGDGRVTLDIGERDSLSAVAIQPNGRIVVAGFTGSRQFGWPPPVGGGTTDTVVARFEPNGDLDPTFGTGGVQVIDLGRHEGAFGDLALRSDGDIVLGSHLQRTGQDADALALRLNPGGQLDDSFSGDGAKVIDFGAVDTIHAVTLDSRDRVVLAGVSGKDGAIARLWGSGRLDRGFAGDGRRTIDLGGRLGFGDVQARPNDELVVVGTRTVVKNSRLRSSDIVLVRLRRNGRFARNFARRGRRRIDVERFDSGGALALQSDRKILLAGTVSRGRSCGKGSFALFRYTGRGRPDGSFSGNGRVRSTIQGGSCAADLGMQANGRIVVAGTTGVDSDTNFREKFGLVRYRNDGFSLGDLDPVVMAAGDIACAPGSGSTATTCQQKATSDLIVARSPAAVLPLGDLQYADGTLAQFAGSYDSSWGRVKSITRPAAGNHEYHTPGAAGYFDYFNGPGNPNGRAGERTKGYYSFDIGSWHLIALNSNCGQVGGCGAGSAQEQWLRADLASHPTTCTLAYWHHPRFSSGAHHGSSSATQALWQGLYDSQAEIVLSGHDHVYERFAPQTATGAADPVQGLRQFVVGTGGKGHYSFGAAEPNSQVRNANSFGVLALTLRANSYEWRFHPAGGSSFSDTGSAPCHP